MTAKVSPLDQRQVGEVWPAAVPAEDPVLYGHVALEPRGAFEARSLQTFTLTYTAGRYGLDDTGSIRVVFRFTADWGHLQTSDPAAPNYVSATSSTGVPLRVSYDADGHQRPWYKALTVMVTKGYLREGERIVVTFGDRTGGSPGMLMQSFCEHAFTFRVLADVCATGHYVPVADSPAIAIVPGPPATWKAVMPTQRRPGEPFYLGIKAEDRWGNPSDQAQGRLHLEASLPVAGLPDVVDFPAGERALRLDGLTVDQPGTLYVTLRDAQGNALARANPLVLRDGATASHWGDLHGQSGESVGINTARDYFAFARDLAFLDATSHQANDFQVNRAFWDTLNDLTARFHEDGRFVVFPGYEWSGNTGVGGDRNVFFRTEGRSIRRSSHALLPDRSDIDSDAPTARDLFRDLADEDCVVYAHIGGRPADVAYAHDSRLETAMEIHSAWGTFEWLLTDCFAQGHRCGVVCNSDGHKGRPGASYPGASSFAAYGGLTCFVTDDLTRDGLFECLRRRHHYGTTGNRIYLDVRAKLPNGGDLFPRDPHAYEDATPVETRSLMMGDIARIDEAAVTLSVEVVSATPIDRVEILNGSETVETLRGFEAAQLGRRVRVLWAGAECKGRGSKCFWEGTVRFEGARIEQAVPINRWNPERLFRIDAPDTVAWQGVTAGNFGGFDAWLDQASEGAVRITANHAEATVDLQDLTAMGVDHHVIPAGGLDRRLLVYRLPEDNPCRALQSDVTVPISARGDNPLWVRVTTEDGFNAWSSPIYLYREAA